MNNPPLWRLKRGDKPGEIRFVMSVQAWGVYRGNSWNSSAAAMPLWSAPQPSDGHPLPCPTAALALFLTSHYVRQVHSSLWTVTSAQAFPAPRPAQEEAHEIDRRSPNCHTFKVNAIFKQKQAILRFKTKVKCAWGCINAARCAGETRGLLGTHVIRLSGSLGTFS